MGIEQGRCDRCHADRLVSEQDRSILCKLCAHWIESQNILAQNGSFPTHDVASYFASVRERFFLKWSDETRLDDDEVETLLRRFFDGIRVTITRVAYPAGRRGFDVVLEDLPLVKNYDCGEDPATVKPQKQLIIVSNNHEFFHADGCLGRQTAVALAMGLNVFVRNRVSVDRQR